MARELLFPFPFGRPGPKSVRGRNQKKWAKLAKICSLRVAFPPFGGNFSQMAVVCNWRVRLVSSIDGSLDVLGSVWLVLA